MIVEQDKCIVEGLSGCPPFGVPHSDEDVDADMRYVSGQNRGWANADVCVQPVRPALRWAHEDCTNMAVKKSLVKLSGDQNNHHTCSVGRLLIAGGPKDRFDQIGLI